MRDEAVHESVIAEQNRLEPERFAAEVRFVKAMLTSDREDYLKGVEKARGKEVAEALRAAAQ